jgi:hypothetical protein
MHLNFIQYLSLINYFLLNILHLNGADINKIIGINFLTVQIKIISIKSIKIIIIKDNTIEDKIIERITYPIISI